VRRLRGQDGKDGRGRGDAGGPRHPRRRDRHGRGIRGSLAPRDVPLSRSRAETFDDLVLDAMEDVEDAVADDAALVTALAAVELGVEDVPPADALESAAAGAELPLARVDRAARGGSARLVLYRRPIELRGSDVAERGDLVHDVVVEQLADLLDVPADRLDPG
jgi:Zincin-like metallopeptidase